MRLAPEVAEIVREFRPGFRVGPAAGSGHRYILNPEGDKVRDDDGQPIMLPLTPSDARHGPKRRRSQLTKAGVLGHQAKERRGHGGIDQRALARAERQREEWEQTQQETPLAPWRRIRRARSAPYSCVECAKENGYETDSEWLCPFHTRAEERARLIRLGIDPDGYIRR